MERSGRLGLGIIGAGRVGPVLAAALAGAGHRIIGITAVSAESRDRAEAMLPGAPILTVPEVVERSELVLIAVPDAELAGLIAGLAELAVWQSGQIVVHTSARHGIGVLAPAQALGIIPVAIHPAMSFTGTSVDLHRLREAWCAVTAPAPVQPIGQALVVELGAEPVLVAEEDRPAYAEAIKTASSFSAALVEQSLSLLRGIDVQSPARLIGPVVRSSVENALGRGGESSIDLASFAETDAVNQENPES